MNRAAFSIILLAVLAHSSIAQTVKNTLGRQEFDRLYRAVVDIAMTCYGDPGKAIGVIGDADGSILKALRSNHFIPVVLVDGLGDTYNQCDNAIIYKLQVFIMAINSPTRLIELIMELNNYIWWNHNANFLIVDTRPELRKQCLSNAMFMYLTTNFAMLNAQFICYDLEDHENAIMIYNSNPFMPRAPKVWTFIREYTIETRKTKTNGFLFARIYQDGGRSCRSINFAKTTNVGGSPLHFVTNIRPSVLRPGADVVPEKNKIRWNSSRIIVASWVEEHRWFIDNIVNALNVSEVITAILPLYVPGISLETIFFSSYPKLMGKHFDHNIMRRNQWPIYAVTQHTGHMTQLDKIYSIIDKNSRIGVGFVYLITFLFFKFFLRQAVMPALLNIVRLTANTGLTTLPSNVAPTLYLTSLFIFVVTLQAIYTGNLAMLLTTTIPYPNVQVKEDIAKLGYTLYLAKGSLTKLTADPSLDGCVVEIPFEEHCIGYVLRDPLAACALDHIEAIAYAVKWNLHVSRFPIIHDYAFHATSQTNIFRRRIEEVLVICFEAGISYTDLRLERLRLRLVDDDEVKKNTARRVMTFDDLRFAFVILGIGLLCSLVCFVGEIVICRVRLRIAKRKDRVRVRSAWGVTATRRSWFPPLNCRFNLRRLFSNWR